MSHVAVPSSKETDTERVGFLTTIIEGSKKKGVNGRQISQPNLSTPKHHMYFCVSIFSILLSVNNKSILFFIKKENLKCNIVITQSFLKSLF